MAGANGKAVAVIGGASLLLWSGIRGIGLTESLQDIIRGKPLPTGQLNPIDTPASSGLAGTISGITGLVASSAIAADAMQYQGAGYKWGGFAGKPGEWDCSSFVSKVLNADLGIPIPGYPKPHTFGGKGHGPTVAVYRLWSGARTVSDPMPGDLICFGVTHIGIFLGKGQMISAENPARGTRVDTFKGGTFRRVGA
jgi:cell wall-associated NlpC family hydrolase